MNRVRCLVAVLLVSLDRHKRLRRTATVLALLALNGSASGAQFPVTGVPVPSLETFDNAMKNFMNAWGIGAGVLAVSKDGCIVYQRGFGWLYPTTEISPLPENAPFRLASVEKPITAAAIRRLVARGQLNWSDDVFNGGGYPGFNPSGILPHFPWAGVADTRVMQVEVQDLLNHQGGWNRLNGPCLGCSGCTGCSDCQRDPQFAELEIGCAMSVAGPAGRNNTIRFMMSAPLQSDPGPATMCAGAPANGCYSNFGYMLLGRIVEQVSGLSHVNYIRQNVLTPDMWVPSTEIYPGSTQSPHQREPQYVDSDTCTNVFDPDGDEVNCAYGGWHLEAFVGHGNLVASAAPLLRFMDNYQVAAGGNSGAPLMGGPSSAQAGNHTGSLDGVNTVIWQRGDGINIVVLFNRRHPDEGQGSNPFFAWQLASGVSDIITGLVNDSFEWPTFCVDGFWVDFDATAPTFPVGSYDYPFHTMPVAMTNTTGGTKLRFKPGNTNWTGTVNKRMRWDAPLGAVTIGQ